MQDNIRNFEVTDPFGVSWQVEFRWHQNAISIRHADAVDCRYYLSGDGSRREVVVALEHASLLKCAAAACREVTDSWCMRLASRHLRRMISTWEDMDKTIVTVPLPDLKSHALALAREDSETRERALLTR